MRRAVRRCEVVLRQCEVTVVVEMDDKGELGLLKHDYSPCRSTPFSDQTCSGGKCAVRPVELKSRSLPDENGVRLGVD